MNDSSLNIKGALESLGYNLSDSGAYWQANAAYRGGDNPTAVQIYKDSGVWIDYVESTTFSPFYDLIKLSLETSEKKDVDNFIKSHNISISSDAQSSLIGRSPQHNKTVEKIFSDSCLDGLKKDYSFYNSKGISSATLSNFSCGLDSKGDMADRFTFPIFNKHGKIHGVSGRDISGNKKAKWKHMGTKSKWIYPYYARAQEDYYPVQEAIQKERSVILVESIGDMLSLYENGHKNVLVTFGLSISSSIICLLCSLDIDKIIISLNNDQNSSDNRGHDHSILNYFKLLDYFNYEDIVICLPCNGKNDFGDMSASDFKDWKERLLNRDQDEQAKYILRYFKANLKSKFKNKSDVIEKYKDLERFFS